MQLVQNRAARLALGCTQRANINNMHVNLSWMKEAVKSQILQWEKFYNNLQPLRRETERDRGRETEGETGRERASACLS